MDFPPLPTIQPDGLPDCKGCGACCLLASSSFADDDVVAGKGVILDFCHDDRIPVHLRSACGHYLSTQVTEPFGLHCIAFDPVNRLCMIYDRRPEACKFWHRNNGCVDDVERLSKLMGKTE